MKIKIKSLIFAFSLFLNSLFILLFVLASFSRTSHISFFSMGDQYITTAAITSIPYGAHASIEFIDITLRPGERAFLQFAIVSSAGRGNLLITPLFDPHIVNVTQTGAGIEITALSYGTTVLQTLTNDGIRNIARVNVL